jgi:hypothetical protein
MKLSSEVHAALVEAYEGGGNPWDCRTILKQMIEAAEIVEYQEPEPKKAGRTGAQNKAMHVGFGLVARALNEAGLDMRTVLKPDIELPWTKDSVKQYLFKPILTLMYGKDHTADLDKLEEPEAVWETMMRFLMQNHGVEHIPFPHDPRKQKAYEDSFKPRGGYPDMTPDTAADQF